eukprot:1158915-Pelagomonas_calceolata.AAC.7
MARAPVCMPLGAFKHRAPALATNARTPAHPNHVPTHSTSAWHAHLRACLFEPVSGFLSKGGGRGECMKSSLISDATPTLPAFVEGAAPPACTLPLQCDGACWSGCVLRAEAGPRAEEARDRRSGGVVVCAGIGCWSSRLSICARVVDPGLP